MKDNKHERKWRKKRRGEVVTKDRKRGKAEGCKDGMRIKGRKRRCTIRGRKRKHRVAKGSEKGWERMGLGTRELRKYFIRGSVRADRDIIGNQELSKGTLRLSKSMAS